MTASPRQPQDRKPKDSKEKRYALEFGGKTYVSEDANKAITPAFMRANRRRDEVDAFFTLIEALWAPEVIQKTVDKMDNDQFGDFMKDFYGWMEASRGESSAS